MFTDRNYSKMSSNSSSNYTSIRLQLQRNFFEEYYVSFISYVSVGSCICLFAFVSNIVCLAAICTYPPLKKRGSLLVANLTIISILSSGTGNPIIVGQILYRQYKPLNENFCDWNIYYYFLAHSFMWHECLIAFNRFVAVVLPFRYKVISTKSALITTILSGYLIAFVINAYPLGAPYHMYVTSPPFGGCSFNPLHSGNYPVIHGALGTYLPMGLIGVCYAILFTLVLVRDVRARWTVNDRAASLVRNQAVQKKRIQLARMLFGSFVWNSVTYLPQPLAQAFLKNFYARYPMAFFCIRSLLLLGVAGNAVVYALLNRDYRDGMMAVIKCRKGQTAPSPSETETARRNPNTRG